MKNPNATRFRHHFLNNDGVLTVATCLDYSIRTVRVGWALFNPSDKTWIKKLGVDIARRRMETYPLYFVLTDNEPIMCDYISVRALQVIIVAARLEQTNAKKYPIDEHPSIIRKETVFSIFDEYVYVNTLLANRLLD